MSYRHPEQPNAVLTVHIAVHMITVRRHHGEDFKEEKCEPSERTKEHVQHRSLHYETSQGAHLPLLLGGSLFAVLAWGLAMVCAGSSLLGTNGPHPRISSSSNRSSNRSSSST